ncbi:MAG: TlpA family protein disulfide reductase [Elusimicrobia bacterium]|nr:TlpA family protein disulfide reductase [Elusimicrobiota bacterium]
MSRSRVAGITAAVAAVVIAFAARKAAPPAGAGSFRGMQMTTADGGVSVDIAKCPTKRCLLTYVAPWCGYCRAGMPMIKELRSILRTQGMESWIVVGLDQDPAVKAYAREIGADALVDTAHAIEPGGVPHFFVVDNNGSILRHIAGLPPDPNQLIKFALKD